MKPLGNSPASIPTVILGAAGLVGGELIRLVAGHPHLTLTAAVSKTFAGESISKLHPHLSPILPSMRFADGEDLALSSQESERVAVFSALPHGKSAAAIDQLLESCCDLKVQLVDLAADFRLESREAFESCYEQPHQAPALLSAFTCGLPELEANPPLEHVAHPGCFSTATILTAAPMVAGGQCESRLVVNGYTGSTGSGARPSATTHHPARHANLKAYNPLKHRHVPEMKLLLQRTQTTPEELNIVFTPHSAPIARGIHVTITARAAAPWATEELVEVYRDFYADAPFVDVVDQPPSLKNVVGTNRCEIAVFAEGRDIVAVGVIDNLTKGAAGGAVQWMNRLLDLPETQGLPLCNPGWI